MAEGIDPLQVEDPSDLCGPFLTALPIQGASAAIINIPRGQSSLGATDVISAQIDQLQFDLGEGPHWKAASSGLTVTIADVATATHDEWPMFGSALRDLPVGALFSIPMKMGAVVVGAVTLYRVYPGDLTAEQHVTAKAIASAVALKAARHALISATDESAAESAGAPGMRREVHQATGMLTVQLGTTATIAYARLQAYAFANGRTMQSVARDVISRDLTFDPST